MQMDDGSDDPVAATIKTVEEEKGSDEAKAAAEMVNVDYKVLKAVTSTADAMKSETIHEGVDKNLCYDWLLGDRKAVDEAFAKADKIIKVDLINNLAIRCYIHLSLRF